MRRQRIKTPLHCLTLAAAAALSAPAQAATCTWNTTNGNWNALANWLACATGNGNPVGVPGGGDTATIGSTGVVTVNTPQAVNTLNHAGQINLDAFLLTLGSGGTTNTGVINVGGASTAALQVFGNVNNAGGVINVGNGSVINQFGTAFTGGTINTSGTGTLAVQGFAAGNFLNGLTLAGNMDMAGAGQVSQRVTGGLALGGTVSVGSGSYLNLQGTQTLSGNGSIVFADSNGNNRLNVDGAGSVLTIGSGVTVSGHTGKIGEQYWVAGGGQSIVNNGSINANVAGGTIQTAAALTNNGTVGASNGGTLRLSANYVGNSGSQLVAGAGSTIQQNGATISGVVNVSGDFRPIGFSAGNFLDGVTLNGNMNMVDAGQVSQRVINGLALNGAINIGSGSYLNFQGPQTLSGNGSIVFADSNGNNRVNVDGQNSVLTIGANAQIRGQTGIIGEQYWVGGGGQSIVNNGRIAADVSGGTVTVRGSTLTNNKLVEALNGGVLRLEANYVGGASSSLNAGTGSRVEQGGVTISGIVNASGDFRPTAFSAGNFLDNVTLNGTLNMAHGTQVSERVTGGLVLNGGVNIGSGSYLNFQGSQTLSGTGSIVFADSNGNNRVNVDGQNSVLTIGANAQIRGQTGIIGEQYWVGGGGQSIVNNGRIAADVSGGTVTVRGGMLTNNSLVEALNGGVLRLDTNYVGNSGSQLVAGTGSAIQQNGVTISGVVNVSGDFRPIGFSANNFLAGATLNGNMNMVDAGQVSQRVINGLALNGAIHVGSGSYLNFQGSQTLSGTGSIVFADSNGNNRLNVDGAGSVLTIGSGVTVSGHTGIIGQQYWVGGGGQSIVNNGTIDANTAGGTLSLARPVSGTGTFSVNGGTLSMGGTSQQGRLQIGSAGTLATNSGHLTISGDYTNTQAGSGNSFNRRAGVTGTGQIQAGGDVQQVITGANVTGGNTANATLTIGNVRVGANNFGYTIGAGGTTGPAMRGAVQTNVNGANLTDSRLGGSGVTASNYSGGAPGGSGETRTVTFVASGAGALAPMSGQVLNLRSTYDNIADQKLNIVMASGAAAYNAAVGSTVTPVQVANQRVGSTGVTATLNISNTAAPGSFSEDLNATIASLGGLASASGSVSGRVAGTDNTGTGAITVGINTATAGAVTGVVNLNYQSTGTVNGVSNGLAAIGVGGQTVTVNGNVYAEARGQLVNNTLNFGTLQVGQQVSTNLAARNIATGATGYVEDLNVRFGASGNGQISGSGSFTGIQAGATSNAGNGTMTVTVNGTTAGALNSAIGVNYFSAGAVGGVSNGLGELAVGSENFGVNGTITAVGNVINQANPQVNNPVINLGSRRVGDAAGSATVSVTNLATAAPQAALNASMASNGAPVTATGSFNLLNPGATNATSLTVGLSTANAGNFTGANAGKATISFVSDASNVGNCAPNCQLTLASQQVDVTGKVYQQATGALTTSAVNFGIVRVGDTVSARNITIDNTAAAAALNDTLRAQTNGIAGPFSGGNVASIGAQSSGMIGIGLSTATAGVFSQTGSVSYLSQNADMADVSGGADDALTVTAQVNNLANGVFRFLGGDGAFSVAGNTYTLDFGNIGLGTLLSADLDLANSIGGPADELQGLFDLSGIGDFSATGLGAIAALVGGSDSSDFDIEFTAQVLGGFQASIVFNGMSVNASDPQGIAQQRTLLLRANVIDPMAVPEPGTLALLLAVGGAGWLVRRRRPVLAA